MGWRALLFTLMLGSTTTTAQPLASSAPETTPIVVREHQHGIGSATTIPSEDVEAKNRMVRERLAAPPSSGIGVDIVPNLAVGARVHPDWRLPLWAAGAARPEEGTILITLSGHGGRTNVSRVLTHELAHLAVHDAAGGHRLPRWFDEGTSRILAGEHGVDDGRALAKARIGGIPLSLEGLEVSFPADAAGAARAYALSARAIAILLDTQGDDVLARILARVRAGQPFESSLFDETGVRTWQLNGRAVRSVSLVEAWASVLFELDIPMLAASMLAVWAFVSLRRRRRAALDAMPDSGDDDRRIYLWRWTVSPFALRRRSASIH